MRNAGTLGGSLLLTWTVALVVRLFLPRHLGPEVFGVFNFADSFAATCFVVLGLGVDVYIQKEIPVRPAHASDFFGGVVAVRVALGALVLAAMALLMNLAHRPPAVQRVVFVFGLAQLVVSLNSNLAALLQANRSVGGLALVNVASKLVWGAGVAVAIVAWFGLMGLALAFLLAEATRSLALWYLVRRALGLRLRLDPAAVRLVVVASLPFYLNQVANTIYAKVDVSMLSVLAGDTEVGWYGAASNLASLALLASPLVAWVLMPLLSRAAARSRAEVVGVLRRAVEGILLIVLPIALLMGVGADIWIVRLFGPSFASATLALRILSPVFVLTYLAMITATCLILLERAWTVTGISLVALVVNPTLNLVLVPWGLRTLGPGGGGAGAATALLLTELTVAVALTVVMRFEAFDRTTATSLGKALIGCAVVVGVDTAARGLGAARLALDLAVYLALLGGLGVLRISSLRRSIRLLREQGWLHART